MRIIYQCVLTLVMGMIADGGNRDKVVEQLRHLAEEMFPEDVKKRGEKEEFMADLLREEGLKEYTVTALFERGGR